MFKQVSLSIAIRLIFCKLEIAVFSLLPMLACFLSFEWNILFINSFHRRCRRRRRRRRQRRRRRRASEQEAEEK